MSEIPRTEFETIAKLRESLPDLLGGLKVGDVLVESHSPGMRPDLLAEVEIGRTKRTLIIEVKQVGEPRVALQAIAQLQRYVKGIPGAYPVFAAPYLTASTRRICKEMGVGYIDLIGNVFLRFDGVFIERTTARALKQEQRVLRSLSTPKAGRVIRRLLSDPTREFGIVDLAGASNVSPAQAYKVAGLLEMKGFVTRDKKRRVLITKPGELLEAWTSSLDFKKNTIVPAYSLARTPEAIMESVAKAAAKGRKMYALTMFAGASLIAPSVRFYDVTCYVAGELKWWMKRLDLDEVETGSNIQLVRPRDDAIFAENQVVGRYRVASNVQLYADLFGNPARGREAAETLRRVGIGF